MGGGGEAGTDRFGFGAKPLFAERKLDNGGRIFRTIGTLINFGAIALINVSLNVAIGIL